MMYKSFKHQKTITFQLYPPTQKTRDTIRVPPSFISKHFKMAASLLLSLSGDSRSRSRVCLQGEYLHISSPIKPKIPNPTMKP
ncbi:hypothetical protein Hanom_Chr13g01209611 [Helianthus anomalus]